MKSNPKNNKHCIAIVLFLCISVIILLSFFIGKNLYFKNPAAKGNIGSAHSYHSAKDTVTHIDKHTNGKNISNINSSYNATNGKASQEISSNIQNKTNSNQKIAYLTFDDGPSPDITPKVLDILDEYKIKATFFVIGKLAEQNKNLLIRERADGNIIGNHTYTHDPNYVYLNPSNLISDFDKTNNVLRSIFPDYTGKLVRFPGGSRNRPRVFVNAVLKAGYHYADWNCLSKDAEGECFPVNTLMGNLNRTARGKKKLIVLMHDASGKTTTVDALRLFIQELKSQGFEFRTLS